MNPQSSTKGRLIVCLAVALVAHCGVSYDDEDALNSGVGWPDCPDGSVVHGSNCVDPNGMGPCDLIELAGGCPNGLHCDEEGGGCLLGMPCGDTICFPGETCTEDQTCTCGAGDQACDAGQVCAPVRAEEDGTRVYECVAADHDGDNDGAAVGDLNNDGVPDDCDDLEPEVHVGAAEVCDGYDNNCDGVIDEGFDEDGDHYTTCGNDFFGPDCDDTNPDVHPGAVDLCSLDENGEHQNVDCSEEVSSCPMGSTCCPGVEGCVVLGTSRHNCGSCGNACGENEYCVVGSCRDTVGEFEPDPGEGEVVIEADEGTSNHPAISWNWRRMNHWFNWFTPHRDHWHTHWFEFFFWELDYGVAWVQQVGDRGMLMFTGRHFISTPFQAINEVLNSVMDFLTPFRNNMWYGSTLVDVLSGEDTIPCLAPSGGLGYGLVWSDGQRNSQIHFAALGEYGGLPGWNHQVTHGSGEHLYPRMAWSPYFYFMGAGFGLVYQVEEGDQVQVFFQNVQSHWASWGFPSMAWPVSADPEGAFVPNIAWSPLGYGVVWVGAEENELYFSMVGHFGGHIIPPTRVTHENNVSPTRPALVWNDADGEFAVVFQGANEPPRGNQDIFFVRITPYGRALAPAVAIDNDIELQRAPDMAWTGNGYGVTWYDRRSSTNEIAFVLLDPQGNIVDGPNMLTQHTGGGEATNPAITFANAIDHVGGQLFSLAGWSSGDLLGAGEFGMVWRDQANENADPRVHFLRMPRTD